MRLFESITNLLGEVRRDIAKSPVLISSRVQGKETKSFANEAMNYSYAIHSDNMPNDAMELAKLAQTFYGKDHPVWGNIAQVVSWLAIESTSRFQPLSKTARLGPSSEIYHTELSSHIEGKHYGYTYRERMIGMLPAMESVLTKNPDSRRAFWPIFEQRDSHRASAMTRIPCTLGYSFFLRNVPLIGDQLHVINYQRSCDFDKFFLSDLWFTYMAQKELSERLNVDCGMINHNIASFHLFVDKEIY